ncbi:MAG: M20/M25/M40 family metallo-hydrolase, partial [Planctomycetota bacterium]
AVATRPAPDSERTFGWIGATRLDSLPGLARKLPHYGKYSFLAFSGSDPTNDAKGQWPAMGSPLIWQKTDAVAMASLPPRKPLGRLAPVFRPEQLRAHVDRLASDELEGRGIGTEGLDRAAEYIAQQFEAMGLQPGGEDGGYFESFRVPGGPGGKAASLRNVIAVLPGSDPEWADQCVVVGAHYDHLGYGWPGGRESELGKIHNGADDNASGVAVLLEVARLLKKTHQPRRSLVFVAFSGEEWGRKGSKHFVGRDHPPYTRDGVLGMINLDSVGRLEGRKLMVLGAGSAYEWPHIAMGIGFTTGVESNAVMDELGASDHQSFQEVGIPAIHLFAGPHEDFHRSTDDATKLDMDGMVQAATWTREALVYLTEREERLKSQLSKKPDANEPASTTGPSEKPAGERRVSLGVMPDYRFRGPGVRVERSLPNTPAKRAGIKAGDVLMSIDGQKLKDLRAYSDLLRRYSPGDRVKIKVERDGAPLEFDTVFQAK